VKKTINSNMYETTLDSVWALFENYLDGERQGLIVILSSTPLGDQARKALQSSFSRLGYGKLACTFVGLQPADAGLSLSSKDLLTLIEGLDPSILVVTDAEAATLCGKSYARELPLDQRSRLYGREIRAFSSFESMIAASESKQKAWALLKSLPKLSS
jgi:hypothetical protein